MCLLLYVMLLLVNNYHQCCGVNVVMLPLLYIAVIVGVSIIISEASSITIINQVTMSDSSPFHSFRINIRVVFLITRAALWNCHIIKSLNL